MKQKLLIILITLGVFLLISFILWSQAETCSSLRSKRKMIVLDRSCKNDQDCIQEYVDGCGQCINKKNDNSKIKSLKKNYSKGLEKGCYPMVECIGYKCICQNDQCKAYDQNT